ncbi:MAG: hypothetical protein WA322_26140 [Pseudolabrys sp.]
MMSYGCCYRVSCHLQGIDFFPIMGWWAFRRGKVREEERRCFSWNIAIGARSKRHRLCEAERLDLDKPPANAFAPTSVLLEIMIATWQASILRAAVCTMLDLQSIEDFPALE